MTVKISVFRDLMPCGWYVEDVSEKSTVNSLKLEASSDVVGLVQQSNALRDQTAVSIPRVTHYIVLSTY